MTVYQSRWGFHPCDFAHYRKLKRVHAAWWQGRRLAAKWRRWHAKRPENRGPEPVVPDVFREILRSEIVEEFQRARHGVPREEVHPLGIPPEALDAWIARLDGPA